MEFWVSFSFVTAAIGNGFLPNEVEDAAAEVDMADMPCLFWVHLPILQFSPRTSPPVSITA